MIYDRPYMREDYGPRKSPLLKYLIGGTAAVYVLQLLVARWFHAPGLLTEFFAISPGAIGHGYLWTIFTYAFLHGSFFHLLGNMLAVFFIGRILLPLVGERRFLQLYFGAVAVGGLVWLLLSFLLRSEMPLVGASAGAFALLILFACIFPDRKITLLIYFVIPVSVRPRYLAYFAVGGTLFALFFFELPGLTAVAHSAHLGGILVGWLFYRHVFRKRPVRSKGKPTVELPAWFRRRNRSKPSPKFSVNITDRKVLQVEVDRILDKINSEGFGSLSEEEKRMLDRARDILSR